MTTSSLQQHERSDSESGNDSPAPLLALLQASLPMEDSPSGSDCGSERQSKGDLDAASHRQHQTVQQLFALTRSRSLDNGSTKSSNGSSHHGSKRWGSKLLLRRGGSKASDADGSKEAVCVEGSSGSEGNGMSHPGKLVQSMSLDVPSSLPTPPTDQEAEALKPGKPPKSGSWFGSIFSGSKHKPHQSSDKTPTCSPISQLSNGGSPIIGGLPLTHIDATAVPMLGVEAASLVAPGAPHSGGEAQRAQQARSRSRGSSTQSLLEGSSLPAPGDTLEDSPGSSTGRSPFGLMSGTAQDAHGPASTGEALGVQGGLAQAGEGKKVHHKRHRSLTQFLQQGLKLGKARSRRHSGGSMEEITGDPDPLLDLPAPGDGQRPSSRLGTPQSESSLSSKPTPTGGSPALSCFGLGVRHSKGEDAEEMVTPIASPATLKLTPDLELIEPPVLPLNPLGIRNIGNSCFIGAALQCLRHTPHLPLLLVPDLQHLQKGSGDADEVEGGAGCCSQASQSSTEGGGQQQQQEEQEPGGRVPALVGVRQGGLGQQQDESPSSPSDLDAAAASTHLPDSQLESGAVEQGAPAIVQQQQQQQQEEEEVMVGSELAGQQPCSRGTDGAAPQQCGVTTPVEQKGEGEVGGVARQGHGAGKEAEQGGPDSLLHPVAEDGVEGGQPHPCGAVQPPSGSTAVTPVDTAAGADGNSVVGADCSAEAVSSGDAVEAEAAAAAVPAVPVTKPSRPERGELTASLERVMKDLFHKDDGCSVDPCDLLGVLKRFPTAADYFDGGQHDCQEVLRILMDLLHDDLNRVPQPPPSLPEVKPDPVEAEEAKAERHWQQYLLRDNSPITDLFSGQLQSSVKCHGCGRRFTMYEPFWDLSLPLAREGKGKSSSLSWLGVKGTPASIQDCFRVFTADEVLEGEEAFHCEVCKGMTTATKHLRVQRFPDALVLQIKRFKYKGANTDKLTANVNFPLKGLDLHQFASPESPCAQEDCIYDLFAVSNHFGSLSGGHYTAMCRAQLEGGQEAWYSYSDEVVQKIDAGTVVSQHAYMLFYARRKYRSKNAPLPAQNGV